MIARGSGKAGLAALAFFFVLFVGIVTTGGCAHTEEAKAGSGEVLSNTLRVVSSQEAHQLVQRNQDNPNFVILDVRTPEEFESGHVEGAMNMDYYHPGFRVELGKLDRTKTYLVYCRTGNRSADAFAFMKELHFKEVYELEGGILAWRAADFPVAGQRRQ
jgi:rhodanese-related sulfurtransferase